MADTFEDTRGPAKVAATTGAAPFRGEPVEESFSESSYSSTRTQGGGRQEVFSDAAGSQGRMLPDSVMARLAEIEKRGPVPDKFADAPAAPDPQAPPAADAKTEIVPPEPPKAKPPEPVAADEWKAERERLEAANKALVAELEGLKGKQPAAVAASKADEAAQAYIDNASLALRRFVAASLGVDDPADKAVDAEIKDLYTELTASMLGVTPDEAHLAKREAARAMQLMAREKRERRAEEAKAAEKAQRDAESNKAAEATTFIGNRLSAPRSDGRSLKDDFPLLHQFSEQLDGMKPEALLWQVIQRETKTGRIAASKDDDATIAAAAKLVETHYQDLADRIAKARPQTSTVQQQPPSTSARQETRPEAPARTLTTADASVAPATPPAKPTETATTSQRSKFKNDKERREWALRHLPK